MLTAGEGRRICTTRGLGLTSTFDADLSLTKPEVARSLECVVLELELATGVGEIGRLSTADGALSVSVSAKIVD
jgi:hypothetical protein